jgi:hypothetical protein
MFNNLCAPTRRALALQDLAANLPVEQDEFAVHGEDCFYLGSPNPLL